MRPEPPANYRPALVERTGIAHFLSHTFRIAVRNLERRPMQALFTVTGLALATGILIVPNGFRDSVAQVLETQWDMLQRQDLSIGLVEPDSARIRHLFAPIAGRGDRRALPRARSRASASAISAANWASRASRPTGCTTA